MKAARYYFLTDRFAIAKDDLATIKTVLTHVANGLTGDVTIKVGTTVGRNDNYVNGSVAKSNDLALRKPYHNLVVNLGTGKTENAGAIKIDENRFMSDLGIKTFIHEATHKYAGTIDYCYFEDDSLTPCSTFDDKSKALINADSYAWFVLRVGYEWHLQFGPDAP